MFGWARDLFPICRSLTGEGVRQTLRYIQCLLPGMTIHEVPTGTAAFDWCIPDEWTIRDAYIADTAGRRLVDFRQNNLHVVGYSEPIQATMTRSELEPHLHSLPEAPDAIPYVTSYYKRTWGFCLTQRQRDALGDGPFVVRIDSELIAGSLSYGELVLPGREDKEILLSTYVCHPSMANNELSGIVLQTALGQALLADSERRYTYRLVFVPETIGAIVYLSRHLEHLRSHVIAGFVVTCVGDERTWSYLPSRKGDTLADRVARHVLSHRRPGYRSYSFLDRGSDERQYCSPGADLPVASIMRSKYGTYPEYHTSLDDLSFITPTGLQQSFETYRECLEVLENNFHYKTNMPCEPQLGRRNLYPNLGVREVSENVSNIVNFLAFADGELDLLGIADTIGVPASDCNEIAKSLSSHGLVFVSTGSN